MYTHPFTKSAWTCENTRPRHTAFELYTPARNVPTTRGPQISGPAFGARKTRGRSLLLSCGPLWADTLEYLPAIHKSRVTANDDVAIGLSYRKNRKKKPVPQTIGGLYGETREVRRFDEICWRSGPCSQKCCGNMQAGSRAVFRGLRLRYNGENMDCRVSSHIHAGWK